MRVPSPVTSVLRQSQGARGWNIGDKSMELNKAPSGDKGLVVRESIKSGGPTGAFILAWGAGQALVPDYSMVP